MDCEHEQLRSELEHRLLRAETIIAVMGRLLEFKAFPATMTAQLQFMVEERDGVRYCLEQPVTEAEYKIIKGES